MKRIKIEQIKVRLLPQSDPRMSGVHTSRIDRKEISRARNPGTESKSFQLLVSLRCLGLGTRQTFCATWSLQVDRSHVLSCRLCQEICGAVGYAVQHILSPQLTCEFRMLLAMLDDILSRFYLYNQPICARHHLLGKHSLRSSQMSRTKTTCPLGIEQCFLFTTCPTKFLNSVIS